MGKSFIRLRNTFFSEKAVKELERQENGKKKVLVYINMLLHTGCYGGALYEGICGSFYEEMSYYFDEDPKIIEETYLFLSSIGLAKIEDDFLKAIAPHAKRNRSSPLYKDWRKSVFERDGYTCRMCKKVGGRLEAHHIKPWAFFPSERYSLENGITLCTDCHKWIHSKRG